MKETEKVILPKKTLYSNFFSKEEKKKVALCFLMLTSR